MKKIYFALGVLGVALLVSIKVATSAPAMITCPAGSHTFGGGTQATGYDMCIPDIGPSGPVSNNTSHTSNTFTPSTKGTIAPSGTTSDTQSQGMTLDAQVYAEVNRLYGTSIYAQAKALYDATVAVNVSDYNSVASQTSSLDPADADPLRRAYNVRAIERLNQVWTQIIALEADYAQQQQQQADTPTTISPTPIVPTPINPTPINPTQIVPTPINPTPINPTPINPTPIVPAPITPSPIVPTPIAAHYVDATSLAPGQTVSAPTDKPANITRPDQSIYMQAGSVIKFIDQNVWQTMHGVIRFLEKTAINGRYKIRTNGGAVVAIRGTQFIVDEKGDTTTLILIKGLVTIKSAKSNASVTLKEGYSIVITNGVPGKPVKIDAAALDSSWYGDIPPGDTFTGVSWQKTAAAGNWVEDCTTTIGQSTTTQTLTAYEQSVVDYLNTQAGPVFSVKEIDTFAAPTKISVIREKTTAENGTKVTNAVINGKSLYYSDDIAGKVWKVFQDKNLTSTMLQIAQSHNIVYSVDRSTMTFDHWEGAGAGNNRIAVYRANATQDGTDSLIHNALSPDASSSSTLASYNIHVDEETQRWISTETNINYPTGKIIMPIHLTCKYTYDTAKIKVPAKAKSVTSAVGIAEMQQIYNAAQ